MPDLEDLQKEAAAAKERYRNHPTEKTKDQHRAAAQALSDARTAVRVEREKQEG